MNYDECDHNFCDDCCHHGECVNCGASNPDFPGCAHEAAKNESK